MTSLKQTIGCVKAASDIIGDKWTPELLRFFLNEDSVRFCQLQDLTRGINPRTLSARLDHLESEGIIVKNVAAGSSRCEYSLTQKGKDLMPIINHMDAWSSQYAHA